MNRILVVVFIASLAGNAVLLARRFISPPREPAPWSGVAVPGSGPETPGTGGRVDQLGVGPGAAVGVAPDLWRPIDTTDAKQLAANLRAAGFQDEDVAAVVRAQILRHFEPRWAAMFAMSKDRPYWRTELGMFSSPRERLEMRQIQREQDAALREALGETSVETFSLAIGPWMPEQAELPLPADKKRALSRIMIDYADMASDIHMETFGGPQMPWDREKLAYLEAEKRKDIAATLTPAELETYDLYASNAAMSLRRQLSGFDATEAEFRALYAIETAHGPKMTAGLFGSMVGARPPAMAEQREQIKAALGEARYADYERVTDQSYQRARDIAARLGLPAETATAAYQLGRDMQRRSEELRNAASMEPLERQAAMAALAQEANAKLDSLLTPDGAKSYRNSSGSMWLRSIEARGGIR